MHTTRLRLEREADDALERFIEDVVLVARAGAFGDEFVRETIAAAHEAFAGYGLERWAATAARVRLLLHAWARESGDDVAASRRRLRQFLHENGDLIER